jgi:DNA-binding transcriptional LysR family regulator
VQVSSPHVAGGRVKVVPLTDAWARRRFAICFRDPDALQAAGRQLVEHLAARAAAG